MGSLVTQNAAELLIEIPAAALASQSAAAVLIDGQAAAEATDVAISVLYEFIPPVPALASSCSIEGLVEADGSFFADQVWGSALTEGPGNFYADFLSVSVLFDYQQLSPTLMRYEPMSDYLFPTLPGLAWDIVKRPKFNTTISRHTSGREVRVSNYAWPIWSWEMSFEFLRAGAEAELQTLMGFFLARRGSFDSFLFRDPDEENELTGVLLGVGDDTQTKWTLYKGYAGFQEPCGYVDPDSVHVYFTVGETTLEQESGWSCNSPNEIEFSAAPPIGTIVTADYDWYYRVRFDDDAHDYSQFLYQLWELHRVTLQTIKP